MVWPDESYKTEIVYDLRGHAPLARPRLRSGHGSLPEPLVLARLVFAKQDVFWATWVAAFATRQDPPRRLNVGPSLFASGQAESSLDRTITLKRL